MDALRNYHWPGNIRELENVLERAVINSSGPKLHLVDELKKPNKDLTQANRTLADVEREYILRCLNRPTGKSAATTVRLKSWVSTAAPCAPACANLISANHNSSLKGLMICIARD
jgi:DNA-binding NtrC family response regulator